MVKKLSSKIINYTDQISRSVLDTIGIDIKKKLQTCNYPPIFILLLQLSIECEEIKNIEYDLKETKPTNRDFLRSNFRTKNLYSKRLQTFDSNNSYDEGCKKKLAQVGCTHKDGKIFLYEAEIAINKDYCPIAQLIFIYSKKAKLQSHFMDSKILIFSAICLYISKVGAPNCNIQRFIADIASHYLSMLSHLKEGNENIQALEKQQIDKIIKSLNTMLFQVVNSFPQKFMRDVFIHLRYEQLLKILKRKAKENYIKIAQEEDFKSRLFSSVIENYTPEVHQLSDNWEAGSYEFARLKHLISLAKEKICLDDIISKRKDCLSLLAEFKDDKKYQDISTFIIGKLIKTDCKDFIRDFANALAKSPYLSNLINASCNKKEAREIYKIEDLIDCQLDQIDDNNWNLNQVLDQIKDEANGNIDKKQIAEQLYNLLYYAVKLNRIDFTDQDLEDKIHSFKNQIADLCKDLKKETSGHMKSEVSVEALNESVKKI